MSEMVERVARVICLERMIATLNLRDAPELTVKQVLDLVNRGWREYEHDARSVIAAMREPSEPMVKAVAHADCTGSADLSWSDGWRLMLDSALR